MKAICAAVFIILFAINANADMYQKNGDDGSVMYTNIPASGSKVVIKEKKERRAERKAYPKVAKNNRKANGEFASVAEEKARKHHVDPKLVKAVINAESNWNPTAVSNKGAVGMMQLMPQTAVDLGVRNRYDPEENIEGGVKYLRALLDKFNGNLTLALAAYNAGPAKVEKAGGVPSIPETMSYVKRVMHFYSGGSGYTGSGNSKIRMVVLGDGTVLFTNAYNTGYSYLTN